MKLSAFSETDEVSTRKHFLPCPGSPWMSPICPLQKGRTQEAKQSQSFLYPATEVSLLDATFPMKALLQSHVIHSLLPLKSSNKLVTRELTWLYVPIKIHTHTYIHTGIHTPRCQKLLMNNDGLVWASKKKNLLCRHEKNTCFKNIHRIGSLTFWNFQIE